MAKNRGKKEQKQKRRPDAGISRKAKKQKQVRAPLVEAPGSSSELELSDEDLDFVGQNTQRLGFLTALDKGQLDKQLNGGKQGKDKKPSMPAKDDNESSDEDDSGGEEYERRPRSAPTKEDKKRTEALPIKTPDGQLVYGDPASRSKGPTQALVPQVSGVRIEEDEAEASEQEGGSPMVSDASETDPEEESDEEEGEPGPSLQGELQEFQLTEERREELKQRIAVACTQLLQDPESHVPNLRSLAALAGDQDSQVAKWAVLSLVAVFRDILPGYRIRLPTEKELAMPVSKEVKKTRDYEAVLLRSYQAFLKQLLSAAGGARGLGFARVGIQCLATLLPTLYHFNYASDLLQALVPRMAHRDPKIARVCAQALQAVLEADVEGAATREAVQLIADLVKRRKCVCPPAVVDILLSLKLSEAAAPVPKGKRGQRIGGSKKPPKRRKKQQDAVSVDFEEAQAKPDADTLRMQQSDTLEVLFEIFFRVLKQVTASGLAAINFTGPPTSEERTAAKFPLLGSSLRGLARFGHMISVEYFSDILEVLLRLLKAPGLPLRLHLSCLQCASDILKGQGEALTIDRRSLHEALYNLLLPAPLAPLLDLESISSVQPAVDQGKDAAEVETRSQQPEASTSGKGGDGYREAPLGVVLTRVVSTMLLEQARSMEALRLAAFAKRVAGVAVQVEPGPAMGLLAVLDRLLRRNQKLRWLLENEGDLAPRAQDSLEDGGLEAAAQRCRGSTLWELTLAKRHAHPHIAQAAATITAIPVEGSAGVSHTFLSSPTGPEGVAAAYDTSSGAFNPAPRLPNLKQKARLVSQGAGNTADFGAATSGEDDSVPTEAAAQFFDAKIGRRRG